MYDPFYFDEIDHKKRIREDLKDRYLRNHNAISHDDQITLAKSRVVIIGFGGLGERVAELLCRLGVGRLAIMDYDDFSKTNINRQLFCYEDNIGRNKVEVGTEILHKINPTVKVEPIIGRLWAFNINDIIDGATCIADCLDNAPSRLMLSRCARKLNIPIVHAAIAGWCGRVAVAYPDSEIMEMLCSSAGGRISMSGHGVEDEEGNLSFTASVAASIQAAKITQVLLGIVDENGHNTMLEFDLKHGIFEHIPLD